MNYIWNEGSILQTSGSSLRGESLSLLIIYVKELFPEEEEKKNFSKV